MQKLWIKKGDIMQNDLFQTIYIFGEEKEIKELKEYLENNKPKDFSANHNECFYVYENKNNNYSVSISKDKKEYISIDRIDNLEEEESYNDLLIDFFNEFLKDYVKKNNLSCEITDRKFNLLYTEPESGIIDK